MEEGVLPQLLDKLRHSELDIMVGRLERRLTSDEFEQTLLFIEPLCIGCRPGHPLLAKPAIDLADTLAYPWILPRPHLLAIAPIQAQMQADPFSMVMRRREARSGAVERFAALVQSISRADAGR